MRYAALAGNAEGVAITRCQEFLTRSVDEKGIRRVLQ